MNTRRRFSLFCAFLGVIIGLVCLFKTTPLSMMAFFNLSIPLFMVGIAVYLYDVARAIQAMKTKD